MAKKILLVQTMNVHRQLLYESVVQSAEITEDSVVTGEVLNVTMSILIPPLPNTPTETLQDLLISAIEKIGSEQESKSKKKQIAAKNVN